MTQVKKPGAPRTVAWRAGDRVRRIKSNELGTISEADGKIKVTWDDGSTSYYFRRGVPANIELAD